MCRESLNKVPSFISAGNRIKDMGKKLNPEQKIF